MRLGANLPGGIRDPSLSVFPDGKLIVGYLIGDGSGTRAYVQYFGSTLGALTPVPKAFLQRVEFKFK